MESIEIIIEWMIALVFCYFLLADILRGGDVSSDA